MDATEQKQLTAEIENKKIPASLLGDDEAYEMEKQVNYWTDYSKTKYHERSYNTINMYQTSNK